MLSKSNKSYVSEVDNFLEKLRTNIPESDAQEKEREKYERINRLRDKKDDSDESREIWQDF